MSAFPPPPPGMNYLAVIQPGLTFSLLGAFFGGLLIPLFIFLFLFTNPAARRHPVFILNVVIVIFGFALAVINVGEQWKNLVTPNNPPTDSLIFANIVFDVFSPLLIDSVLLFRLLAFYPRMITPRSTFIKVLAFPVFVKCGRLISVTLFLHQMNQTDGENSVTILANKLWFRNPYLISEWSLQITDNLLHYSSESLLARLRGVFVIALANFIFPLFMNITQLIMILRDRDYALGTEVLFANLYVSIFGVLFATVWASGHAWGRNHLSSQESTTTGDNPGYMGRETDPRSAGSSLKVIGKKLPQHYSLSFQGNQSATLGAENSVKDSTRSGIHVEQVVIKDSKSDDFLV
ncbi:hypothetical protein C0991_005226 [Blastosporella zonata]|nr:hypothetical protein C0991_005226 [Blastosporella zonata]